MSYVSAISAQGTKLMINSSGSAGYEVGGLKSYKGFDGSADEINVTNLSSSGKEFIAGLQDAGKVTIELNRIFGDSGQECLIQAQSGGVTSDFQLRLPNGYVVEFKAAVVSFSLSGGVGTAVTSSVVLRISGKPNVAVPSSKKSN